MLGPIAMVYPCTARRQEVAYRSFLWLVKRRASLPLGRSYGTIDRVFERVVQVNKPGVAKGQELGHEEPG